MTTQTMTIQEEENFLIDTLQSARIAVEEHKKSQQAAVLKCNQLEKNLADAEQALVDYMLGNGLLETERLKLGSTESVCAPDIDAIPEEYIRTKIVREPNKILIKELRPDGANWYSIEKNYKITVR